jgi:hypothetical protein
MNFSNNKYKGQTPMKLLNILALTLLAIPAANAAEKASSSASPRASRAPTSGLIEHLDLQDLESSILMITQDLENDNEALRLQLGEYAPSYQALPESSQLSARLEALPESLTGVEFVRATFAELSIDLLKNISGLEQENTLLKELVAQQEKGAAQSPVALSARPEGLVPVVGPVVVTHSLAVVSGNPVGGLLPLAAPEVVAHPPVVVSGNPVGGHPASVNPALPHNVPQQPGSLSSAPQSALQDPSGRGQPLPPVNNNSGTAHPPVKAAAKAAPSLWGRFTTFVENL